MLTRTRGIDKLQLRIFFFGSRFPDPPNTTSLLAIISLRPHPKYILLYLSRASLWQLIYNLHLPRDHELTYRALIFRPLNKILSFQILTLLDSDKGFGTFTPLRNC